MKAYMKMHNSDEINRIQDMPLDRINTTIDGDEASLPLGELDDVSGGTSKTNREQYSGIVVEALVCTNFKVLLNNGSTVTAYMSGMMRCNNIQVLVGDRVTVEISPYDPTRGRIISCEK